MKITSRLALDQLKRNKKRTLGTIAAIALSTALTTAVICFAESGASMLKDVVGDDYDGYGGAYRAIVFIPAFILTLLVAIMSISVISNIFQASANDRIKELGILRCVGATSKQIRETVICEGILLSTVGIPAGLILGTALGFAGVKIAGGYIYHIAEITKSIIMRRVDLRLDFSVRIGDAAAACAFSFVNVMISALRPAVQMSGITAVRCVTFGGNSNNERSGRISGNRLWRKLWGIEGELGVRNISRNRKSFKPAVRALSMGICLLLSTFGITAQLRDMEKYMKSEKNLFTVDYTSLRNEGYDPETGRRRDIILNPIGAERYNEINDRLSSFGDFEVFGIGGNRDTYFAKADDSEFTEAAKEISGIFNENGEMEFDMVSLTDSLYSRICRSVGIEEGGNILINTYTYNENGERKEITPFRENIKGFTLVTPDGKESSLEINGSLDRSDTEDWYFDYLNRAAVMVIVPGAEARNFRWMCEPGSQEEDFAEYARTIMEEYYPVLSDDPYEDQGYSVRISREDTMVMAVNVMIVLGEIILYGFVIMLALIGFGGFISTVAANIRARSKEFAVLKTVGMTGVSLRKMLYSESMYCTVKAAVSGSIMGTLIPLLINLSVRNVFPIKFHLPLYMGVLSIAVVFPAVLLITYIEIKRMKGQSLIETIRIDSVR